jgi:hypothetical protein
MPPTTYTFGSLGNARFFRAVADALGELDPFFSGPAWKEDSSLPRRVPALARDETVRALGALEVAGAFTIFIASCFGKKIFDEVYDRLLKRPLAPFLDRLFAPDSPVHGKSVELRDVIYLEDIDTTVVVRAILSAEEAQAANTLLLNGHRVAHAYLAAHGRKAPVHCHTVKSGQVNVEPELYLSLEHEHRQAQSRQSSAPDASQETPSK